MIPILTDLAVFAGTAVVAIYSQWQTRDLIWSLWFSSLTVGYALIVTSMFKVTFWPGRFSAPMKPHVFRPGTSIVRRIFWSVLILGFFSFHFGAFHLGHAFFLHHFVPLVEAVPEVSRDDRFVVVLRTLVSFWPFALASALSLRASFLQGSGAINLGQPYMDVLRMHAMIFVFIAADMLHIRAQWILMVILFVYFFPVKSVRELIRPS